jgi:multiple sugar transport system substrate-binding protein
MNKMILPLALAAMLAAPAAQAVDLTLWVHPDFSPSAGLPSVADAYKQAYAEFEKENPGITLKYEIERGGTEALQQFLTAATSNTLPDLALLDGFWISRLTETGKLQPLNDLWSEESRSHWLKQSIDAVTLDGKIYAVPFHTSWRGLFYPIDTMKQLGFDTPPQNWDQLLQLGEKAKAEGMSATMLPMASGEVTALHMLSMFWGLGGKMVDDTGKPVFFEGKNRQALEKVYSLYRELIEKGMMPADTTLDETKIRPFLYAHQTASIAASTSRITTMYTDDPALKGNLGAFNYPLPGDAKAVPVLTGFTYGIFTADAEKRAAAWKFISFITRPDVIGKLNALAGHLPVVNEVWDQPFYKNDPLMQQFRAIVEHGGMRPRPSVPIYPVTTAAWAAQMADVATGKITPAQAVDKARDTVMAQYQRLTSR